jgi:hypothetical protein
MADWSRKDTAETWVFVLGLVTAAFLAFMPYAVERKYLSLGQCCLFAFLLSIATLGFFLKARTNGAREEKQRKAQELGRDQLLGQILHNQLEEMRMRGEARGPSFDSVEIAAGLYTAISTKPAVGGRVVGDDALNGLIRAAERLNMEYLQSDEIEKGIQLARPKAPKPLPGVTAFMVPTTTIDSLRSLADLLARSSVTGGQ